MFNFSIWSLRLFGISGIIGSILFICGDLLYNHIPGSKASPAVKMSALPESRLLNAGTFGMIGCWFYTLAALHVYVAFLPAGNIFASLVFLAFAAVMISFGIAHTAYFSIASGAKAAAALAADGEKGGKLGNGFFQRVTYITYVPTAIATLLMAAGILMGRSMYPRWMVIFLPVVIYLLKIPVLYVLKGRTRELVNDSYDNLSLFVFFALSTILLWNGIVP
ncbi:MAG: DUF6796 family protein [Anaerolineales bacterium]|jgi:hypothetical protein